MLLSMHLSVLSLDCTLYEHDDTSTYNPLVTVVTCPLLPLLYVQYWQMSLSIGGNIDYDSLFDIDGVLQVVSPLSGDIFTHSNDSIPLTYAQV
jgi:hypothetical protein